MGKILRFCLIPLLALLLLLGSGALFVQARDDAQGEETSKWSSTTPPVNMVHIFEGEINRRGRPVGFHSRPGGKDPANARVVAVIDSPNRFGVYTAKVEIFSSGDQWLSKRSTFYPDKMDREGVIAAVLHAYQNRVTGDDEKFRGPSGAGFTIEGYLLGDKINTAYPLYTKD